MEHSQKEFIREQLKSVHKMVESHKGTELLFFSRDVNHLDKEIVKKIVHKKLLALRDIDQKASKEILIKNYSPHTYDKFLREYLIGLRIINPLRKITPCFVHTLGALLHEASEKYRMSIIYEEVPGSTLAIMLQEGMSFSTWLLLFFQLMLSLEIAQRRTGFTHYDLHANNIVIKDGAEEDYSISLDYISYQISKPKLIPVIIDFGTSSTSLEGRFIGSYDYSNSGVFHFIVSGHDMYKLMVSSYSHAKNSDTRQQILKLFSFFKTTDPYKISQGQGNAGISKAKQEFCRKVPFSDAASYTPMMMIKYIYSKFYLRLSPVITLVPRNTHVSLRLLNGTEDYAKILVSARKLIDITTGYITVAYLLHIIDHSMNSKIKKKAEALRVELNSTRKKHIEKDFLMLEKVFSIKLPSQEQLNKTRDTLLKLPIRHRNASMKEQCFDNLEEVLKYQEDLKPFLDTYFTILELGMRDTYTPWIRRFCQSKIYKFHITNKIENDRAWRWGETLLASIFSDC